MARGYYDGDTFERNGYTFRVRLTRDEDICEPWKEFDGHGPVSEWTRRGKASGERILVEDRGSYRYYDFRAAVAIARRDGWGCEHTKVVETDGQRIVTHGPHTSRGARAACAAETDYNYLRRFCEGQWGYVCVEVTHVDDEGTDGETTCLGGVESDSSDYIETVCNELADELLQRIEVENPDIMLSEN